MIIDIFSNFDVRAGLLYWVAKKVPDQVLVCGIGTFEGSKIDDQGGHFDSFIIDHSEPFTVPYVTNK